GSSDGFNHVNVVGRWPMVVETLAGCAYSGSSTRTASPECLSKFTLHSRDRGPSTAQELRVAKFLLAQDDNV
ncbi:MAG TPA: hypothetical protein VIL63_01635, partial [Terriglobales bacterium]